jgi:hypothetical protein
MVSNAQLVYYYCTYFSSSLVESKLFLFGNPGKTRLIHKPCLNGRQAQFNGLVDWSEIYYFLFNFKVDNLPGKKNYVFVNLSDLSF